MSKTLEETRGRNVSHKSGLILALCFIVLFGILGIAFFFGIWREGDAKAEAFSGLLAFVAATLSSVVTIIYVYLTNASLRKAQASISLQQQQLEQMKSSVDLQQKEWEQKVRVFPQFWVTTDGIRPWFTRDPKNPNSNQLVGVQLLGDFVLNIWNYSEQSFLVDSARAERLDVCGLSREQIDYLQLVVTPHSVQGVNMSVPIMRLLTQTPADNQPENLMKNQADRRARIGIRLTFSDWSQSLAESEIHEFEFEYGDKDRVPRIRRVTQRGPRPLGT